MSIELGQQLINLISTYFELADFDAASKWHQHNLRVNTVLLPADKHAATTQYQAETIQ
jgi:hypothetical protein